MFGNDRYEIDPEQQSPPVTDLDAIGAGQQRQVAPMPDIDNLMPGTAPGIESRLTASDLGGFTRNYTDGLDADREAVKLFNQQYPIDDVTGPLPANAYFPGMNEPILKGYSSSKTLGSQPIFVRSGAYYPMAVLDARKQALKNASIERAKQQRAFDIPKKPLVKDPRFQERVNQQFDSIVGNYIDRAKKQYGENAFVVLKDPKTQMGREFLQAMDNLEVLARETDQVTDRIAEIKKGSEDKTMTYSKETLDLVDDYQSLVNRFEGGEVDVEMRKNLNQLAGSQDLDKFLNDKIYPKLQYSVNEAWSKFKDQGDFNEARSFKKSTIRNQAKILAKETKDDQYARAGWITEDDIYNRLVNMFGDKLESDIKTVSKPSGGDGYDVPADKLFLQTDKQYKIGGENVNAKNIVGLNQKKNAKPWNLAGAHTIDPKTGKTQVAGDIKNFQPLELARIESTNEKGEKVWTNVIVGTKTVEASVSETNSKGQKVTRKVEQNVPEMIPVEGNQKIIKQQIPNAYQFFEDNPVGPVEKQKVVIGNAAEETTNEETSPTGGLY